jgi:hypothetical protein
LRHPDPRLGLLSLGVGSIYYATIHCFSPWDVKDASQLESRIANHLEASLGYNVDTFVRTAEAIGRTRVFPEDGQAGITIHGGFLQQKLAPEVAREFATVRGDKDEFRVIGREYYWLCRVRTSDSKVWMRPEIKALRLPMRNMTSLRKLIAQHIDRGLTTPPSQ